MAEQIGEGLAAPLVSIAKNLGLLTGDSDWFSETIESEPCILILDALDQIDEQQSGLVFRWLKALENSAWPISVLVTCRTADYHSAKLPWRERTVAEIAPLQDQERLEFVDKWFDRDDESANRFDKVLTLNPGISHACRSPLILTLACRAHELNALSAESRLSEIYESMIRDLCKRSWKDGELGLVCELDDFEVLLMNMARDLYFKSPTSNRFNWDDLSAAVSAAGSKGSLATGNLPTGKIITQLLEIGLLIKEEQSSKTRVSFVHRTFLEFLAAGAVAVGLGRLEESQFLKELARYAELASSPVHGPFVVFLAGLVHSPNSLIELLCDETTDDFFRHRLCLAAHCLPNLPPSIEKQSLTKRVSESVISLWRQFENLEYVRPFNHVRLALPNITCANTELVSGKIASGIPRIGDEQPFEVYNFLEDCGPAALTQDVIHSMLSDLETCDFFQGGRALRSFGSSAAQPEFVSELLRLLESDDRRVVWVASEALNSIHPFPSSPEVAHALVSALGKQHTDPRLVHLTALEPSSEIIDILIGSHEDTTAQLREQVVYTLGLWLADATTEEQGKIVEVLKIRLADDSADVRSAATKAFSTCSHLIDESVIDQFVSMIRDADVSEESDGNVSKATDVLSNIGFSIDENTLHSVLLDAWSKSYRLLPAIGRLLKHSSQETCRNIAIKAVEMVDAGDVFHVYWAAQLFDSTAFRQVSEVKVFLQSVILNFDFGDINNLEVSMELWLFGSKFHRDLKLGEVINTTDELIREAVARRESHHSNTYFTIKRRDGALPSLWWQPTVSGGRAEEFPKRIAEMVASFSGIESQVKHTAANGLTKLSLSDTVPERAATYYQHYFVDRYPHATEQKLLRIGLNSLPADVFQSMVDLTLNGSKRSARLASRLLIKLGAASKSDELCQRFVEQLATDGISEASPRATSLLQCLHKGHPEEVRGHSARILCHVLDNEEAAVVFLANFRMEGDVITERDRLDLTSEDSLEGIAAYFEPGFSSRLFKHLGHANYAVRYGAAAMLLASGATNYDEFPESSLVQMLRVDDEPNFSVAAKTLGRMPTWQRRDEILQILVQRMRDAKQCREVCMILPFMFPSVATSRILLELISILNGSNEAHARAAHKTLDSFMMSGVRIYCRTSIETVKPLVN